MKLFTHRSNVFEYYSRNQTVIVIFVEENGGGFKRVSLSRHIPHAYIYINISTLYTCTEYQRYFTTRVDRISNDDTKVHFFIIHFVRPKM